jgi:CBS domain-containing protein/sporulation protein YlmC with PRC-barrel domain
MVNGITAEVKARAAAMFMNFSDLMKKEVRGSDGEFLGNFWDVSVSMGDMYPKAAELIVYRGALVRRSYAALPWPSITAIEDDVLVDRSGKDVAFSAGTKDYAFLLRRDILDQQVVDTFNHKVRRVNDINLLRVGHDLMVAHVEIGLRSLFRRLGWESPVDAVVRIFAKDSQYLKKHDLVSWKFVQPVTVNPASMTMKLSLSEKQLLSIPAADLGEIMFDLNMKQRIALFRALDLKTQTRILESVGLDERYALLKELSKKEAAAIVSGMSADEATDLLEKLPRDMVNNLLSLVESSRAKKLSTLLGYAGDSAGGLMTTEFVALAEAATVESAIDFIRNHTKDYDTVPYIYIVDDRNHLKGVTTIRRLLFAQGTDPISSTAFQKTLYVYLDDSAKEIAFFMDKYKVSAIPVVDENRVLQGIITIDDILSQVISIAWRKRSRMQGL